MVICYHFGPHIVPETGGSFQFLGAIPPFWFEGVDLFFVLSGFLISGILVENRNSPRYFGTFYVRRAFRIFPLYYIVFACYCIVIALLGPGTAGLGRLFELPLPAWPYALYMQNFGMALANSFGPIWLAGTWSLAVEEQFYFTLPAIVRTVSEKTLFRLAVAAMTGAPLLRASIQKFRWLPGLANYVLLPTCIDSLAAGVLVMLLLRKRRAYLQARQRQIGWIVMAGFVFWTIYPFLPNPQAIRMAFLNRTGNSLVFGGVLLLIMIAPNRNIANILSRSGIRGFGNMAYSTYLFHPILLCIAFRIIEGQDPVLHAARDIGPLLAAAAATLALSWASWTYFERPLLRIGHRFHLLATNPRTLAALDTNKCTYL